ncbi:FAD-dependent oxidoreductase, partial [Microvirga sp. 3-52]|nr:FAD-dependent oxidoreductase [Microvirga sp. 3-52]
LNTVVTSVERSGDQVDRATYRNVLTGSLGTVEAFYFIDATEAGDVLPLAEVAYVTGAEAISETNEPHAVKAADPKDIQAFTYVLGIEYRAGEDNTIPEPELYSFWRDF